MQYLLQKCRTRWRCGIETSCNAQSELSLDLNGVKRAGDSFCILSNRNSVISPYSPMKFLSLSSCNITLQFLLCTILNPKQRKRSSVSYKVLFFCKLKCGCPLNGLMKSAQYPIIFNLEQISCAASTNYRRTSGKLV